MPRKSKKSIETDPISPELKAHFAKEQEILNHILGLEKQFRDHYELVLKELQLQRELIDRLWVLSQRYIILIGTGPCCKYPEVYSSPAEVVVLREFHDKLKALRSSNIRIMNSIKTLRPPYLAFHKSCRELDMTLETPFILGDTFHKPLAYFIELISDVFKYLHAMILKLKCRSHQLDPEDAVQLDEYKGLLEMSEDFEDYFYNGLTYCKCLQPKPVCKSEHTTTENRPTPVQHEHKHSLHKKLK